jgi:hypothetical protein
VVITHHFLSAYIDVGSAILSASLALSKVPFIEPFKDFIDWRTHSAGHRVG